MAAIHQVGGSKNVTAITLGMKSKLLSSIASTATSLATAQLDKFATRLADALMQLSDTSSDIKQASLSFNAANLLKKNLYAYHFLALGSLQKAIQNELGLLEMPVKPSHNKTDEELTLVPYEAMDKQLLLNNMARPFEAAHAEQLTALRLRFGYLVGREELSNNQNPLRPEVFISAINEAWCEFNPDTETHNLVLPLLSQDVFLDLAPIYLALNNEMISAGVLPELADHYNIKKTTGSKDTKKPQERLAPEALQQLKQIFSPQAQVPEIPMQQNGMVAPLFPGVPIIPGLPAANGASASTQTMEAWQSAPAQYASTTPMMPSSQLLGFLTGLQRMEYSNTPAVAQATYPAVPNSSILSGLKTTAPQGTLSQVDESTIDLLSKIFDTVFRDQHIPQEIKGLIGFLQIPILKTALVDKDFFFQEEHPARKFIELLTKTSVGWDKNKGEKDPIYQTIKRNVNRVQEELENQTSIFSTVVSDLETFIQQEDKKSSEVLAESISQAMHHEKIAEATKIAKNEVSLRIGTGEVVAFVETFLESKWVPVLTLAYSIKEEKPHAVDSALKTMDDLIWSVKPKITMEERKELIAKLPAMLSMLNKWLNLVKLDDAERLQFFAELAECHASIVRAPLEMSPQRRLEIAMEVAQKAAEQRKLRETAKQAEPEPVVDAFVHSVENLERGMWVEFTQKDASIKKVKLSWISPKRTLFIFSNSDKSESFSISTEDLAQTLRDERAHILILNGLVDRAINEALGHGVANDEEMDEKSAA